MADDSPSANYTETKRAVIKMRNELTVAIPNGLEASKEAKSRNGFRHVSLSLHDESRLVFHTDRDARGAQQFRLLRRNLTRDFQNGGVLIVTSPGMGDGKTFTCLNLCACLANSGEPTLLVEADFRRPRARKILGSPIEPPGVEEAFEGKIEPRKAIHFIPELSLHAATVAKIPENPSRSVNGEGARQFLQWARQSFRWIVLDAAPVLPCADAVELLPLADAALLVMRIQSTPRELGRRAVELLGSHLHGVVLNEATIDSNPHYRHLHPSY